MVRFLKKAVSFLFGPAQDVEHVRPTPKSDRARILAKLPEWELLAAEHEREGRPTLAREYRERVDTYRRHFAASSFLNRAA